MNRAQEKVASSVGATLAAAAALARAPVLALTQSATTEEMTSK